MIVEDEHGNDIDLNDLRDDQEPEPPDEAESLTLEEIEELFARCTSDDTYSLRAEEQLFDVAIPQMLAELRTARAELERLYSAKRCEYAITDGSTPDEDARLMPEQQADFVLAHPETLKQAWVRTVCVGPWQALSAEPPF